MPLGVYKKECSAGAIFTSLGRQRRAICQNTIRWIGPEHRRTGHWWSSMRFRPRAARKYRLGRRGHFGVVFSRVSQDQENCQNPAECRGTIDVVGSPLQSPGLEKMASPAVE